MKNKLIITTIAAAVIFAGAGFFGGMKYQQSKVPTFARNFAGANGARFGNTNRANNFRPVMGEVLKADDKSITVKLTDGSSKIVLFSDSTQINQAATATKEDLKVGAKVAAYGTQNSDGSVTAQSIQINPQMPGN